MRIFYGLLLIGLTATAVEEYDPHPSAPLDVEYPHPETMENPGFLNRAHDALFHGVQSSARWLDGWFADAPPPEDFPFSEFRLGLYTQIEERGGSDVSIDPDFDIELELPSWTRRFRFFATTEELDQLENRSTVEEPRGFRLGLREVFSRHVQADAGAKVRMDPYFFSSVRLHDEWTWGETVWAPGAKGFWRSDLGFGGNPYLSVHQYRDPWCFRVAGSILWAEHQEEPEWESSITLAHAKRLIDPIRYTNFSRAKDLAQGSALLYRMGGRIGGNDVIDAHQLQVHVKVPIIDHWGFLVLSPMITWRDVEDWKPEPGIMLGLDLLFHEPASRKAR